MSLRQRASMASDAVDLQRRGRRCDRYAASIGASLAHGELDAVRALGSPLTVSTVADFGHVDDPPAP